MRVGVNYVPSGNWFYEWFNLDRGRVANDMAAIASLGLDHVRVFPLWELLQPNRTLISDAALGDLDIVVEEAGAAGLDVSIDCLQGHLSSYDFVPSWLTSWHERNVFTDPDIVEAECRLISTIARRYAGFSHVKGVSLGNEFLQFAADRHPDTHALSSTQARSWLSQLLSCAHAADPSGCHTFSFDDDLLFDPTHPFSSQLSVTMGDAITIHSWIFGRLGPALGADHPRLGLFARYLLEIVQAWSSYLGVSKPLWLQEVGAPLNYLSREAQADFLLTTLDHAVTVKGLSQVTWWCSHDVDRRLADFPDVEYDLGLLTASGELKPVGQAMSQWVAQMRQGRRPLPTCADAGNTLPIPAPDDDGARLSLRADGELFSQWADAIEQGRPCRLEVARVAQSLSVKHPFPNQQIHQEAS